MITLTAQPVMTSMTKLVNVRMPIRKFFWDELTRERGQKGF